MMPSQKAGMPRPTIGMARTIWSITPSLRRAAKTASGTEMIMASSVL
jgi:hypothetical protein